MTRRIIFATLSVTIIAVVLFGVPLAIADEHRQRDQDRRELTQLAALAATRVRFHDGDIGKSALPPRREPEQELGLYDTDGALFDGSGPPQLDHAARGALHDRVVDTHSNGSLVVAVPVVDPPSVIGVVRASEPLAAGSDRVHNEWGRLTILALAAIAVAGVAAWAFARRLARPLGDLRRDAARIGDGDFTVETRTTGLREVDEVGAALTKTADRVNGLLAREQAFTADASHQLKTPLAALRVTLEAELEVPRSDPNIALTESLQQVDRLESTIEDLLTLARDAGTERAPLDVHTLLREAESRWRRPFADARRTLTFDSERPVPDALASGVAISHVLDVLLDNARRHSTGAVLVTARAHHGVVSIAVQDDGPGIPDPKVLFKRRQRGADGNGIGLALARRLVEAEGGRLVLRSGAPGATFDLTLPVPPNSG